MEYQEIMTLLDHENTQPSRFRTKTWIEINDARREKYNKKKHQVQENSVTVKSLWILLYIDIIKKGTIKVVGRWANDAAVASDGIYKEVIFKNYTPFIDCINEINKTQIDNANYLYTAKPMSSLID